LKFEKQEDILEFEIKKAEFKLDQAERKFVSSKLI